MYAEIVLAKAPLRLDKVYHYIIPQELAYSLSVGSQVQAPFGNSSRIGYVVGFTETSDVPNLKAIQGLVSNDPVFSENGLKLARWISEYYLCSLMTALRAMLPPGVKNARTKRRS